jgi:hypothetical protein
MAYLTRDVILQADDLLVEDVEVPEWGGVVRVRGLTGAERDDFEASVVEQRGKKTRLNMQNFRAKLVVRVAINGDGQRLFTDKDASLLGRKSAAALQRVFEVAQRLSGLSDQDVEELVGNFDEGQSAASISD